MKTLVARKTALIIQDLQNDAISDGGAWAESGAPEHAGKQNAVANVKMPAEAARKVGIPVIHVPYILEPGVPGVKQNAPIFLGCARCRCGGARLMGSGAG